jgi:hypothetical protein
VNWVEYFEKSTPKEAIAPLREIFEKKKFKIGATSKFALLNVGAAKTAAARYTSVSIVLDAQENDPSHSLIRDYDEALTTRSPRNSRRPSSIHFLPNSHSTSPRRLPAAPPFPRNLIT